MLEAGTKIEQIKQIGLFDCIGKEFEVENISKGIIQFSCDMGIGYMDEDVFKEYFRKVWIAPQLPGKVVRS